MHSCLSITPTRMRSINQTAVLEYVRIKKSASKTELSEELGLSLPSIGRIVDDLVERRILRYSGKAEIGSIGRRRTLLELDVDNNIAVSVEVREASVEGSIIDLEGKIIQTISVPFMTFDCEGTLNALYEAIAPLNELAMSLGKKYYGIAIVVPCVVDRDTGSIIHSEPHYFKKGYPLGKDIHERFRIPVIVENDSNAAALGEMWFGKNTEIDNLALLYLKKGLGLGVIIDGSVYMGTSNASGEIGNLVFSPNDFSKEIQSDYGPIEKKIAGVGLLEKAKTKLREIDHSLSEKVTYDMLFQSYKNGEKWTEDIVHEMLDTLAMVIIVIHSMLDCKKIVLSGEVIDKADFILPEITNRIYENIKVEKSELGDFSSRAGGLVDLIQREMDYYVVKSVF